MELQPRGKVGNFFGLSVCHCCHFVLRMQFLSGAGLAKMRALAPVAEGSQPVDALPLESFNFYQVAVYVTLKWHSNGSPVTFE